MFNIFMIGIHHFPEKDQDSVYNNLLHLYDATKGASDMSTAELKRKVPKAFPKKYSDEDFINMMEKFIQFSEDVVAEADKRSKLSILSQLLSAVDAYRRTLGAVQTQECNQKCDESKQKYRELYKQIKILAVVLLILAVVISSVITLVAVYFFAVIGNSDYISFFDNNLIGILLTGILGIVGYIWLTFKKILKEDL